MENQFPSVLMRVKNWQTLYGVKRGNFKAYKTFTTRRSKKIRKKLGIMFGKKFDKKKYTELFLNQKKQELTDQNRIYQIVQSLLLIVEKNYIHYNESKQQTSNLKKTLVKKKLRKALQMTHQIQDNYGKYLNQRILLELKVYEAMIKTALFLEKKCYQEAKQECIFLIGILKQLLDLVTVIEKAQIQEMIRETEQQLRYCKFQLKEFGEDEEQFVIIGQEDIQAMLNQIEQDNKLKGIQKYTIQHFGKNIDIDDQKLINLNEKNKILEKGFLQTEEKNAQDDLFWEIVNNFEEGIKICHDYKIESGNNADLVKHWDMIEDYLANQKTINFLQRNLKIYKNLRNKLQSDNKKEKPQEFIKICDMILGHLRKIIDLNSKYQNKQPIFNFLESFFRIKKCFGISMLYYINKCYKQSLSLIEVQKTNINTLNKFIEENKQLFEKNVKEFDEKFFLDPEIKMEIIFSQIFNEYLFLQKDLLILGKQNKIAIYDEQQKNMDKLKTELGNINLKQDFEERVNVNCLLDLVIENRESSAQERMEFVKIPPLSELIPTRPINLDLASDFIDYQELDYSKFEPKEEKKGFFNKIWATGSNYYNDQSQDSNSASQKTFLSQSSNI